MPANRDRDAILRGMRAATRLHRDLGSRESDDPSVRVDVYGAIARSGAALMFQKLDPLLGAFMREGDMKGIMITLQRPVGVQRFTAAHELGHLVLNHEPHADGDDILRRAPVEGAGDDVPIQEREADAFASHFLLPKFALAKLQRQQDWAQIDYQNPHTVYQASLRLGASYAATIRAYHREGTVNRRQRDELLRTQPKTLKAELVDGYEVNKWANKDVWRLTEQDEGCVIEAGRDDLFLLKLKEHRGSGYLWSFSELENAGFLVLKDEVEAMYPGRVGGVRRRRVLGAAPDLADGEYALLQKRPWGDEAPSQSLTLRYRRIRGREPGLLQDQLDEWLGQG